MSRSVDRSVCAFVSPSVRWSLRAGSHVDISINISINISIRKTCVNWDYISITKLYLIKNSECIVSMNL